ncbi:hypothetical protein OTU49_003497 [Cherax quadricarinatus]|uniref:thioredoxin-dependent peroxiredoxin n=2 Tax=Cherax quadricarinatus TaxID=27406 RepID=A0AAW0XHZ6_CHEQU
MGRTPGKRQRQEEDEERKKEALQTGKTAAMEVEVVPPTDAKPQTLQNGYIHVGAPAPDFKCDALVDMKFKEVAMKDYHGKFIAILFYPLDFTFVCPTEIISFAERIDDFHAVNCEVLGCSTDSKFTHLAWCQTPREKGGVGQIPFPLLADKSMEVSKKYGVLNEAAGVAHRTLVIIDTKLVIREVIANDSSIGRSVDETLRLIQALQYADKHGQVCPAGWKPGDQAIDPNEKKMDISKE